MFEVSANLTSEILAEKKNAYKEVHLKLKAPINRVFGKRGVFKS